MRKTLAEIAEFIDGEVIGDGEIVVTDVCGIKDGKKGSVTFVDNSRYFPLVEETEASAVITPRDFKSSGKVIIRTDNPSLAFAKVASLIVKDEKHKIIGIHETAIIANDVIIGKNVTLGPYVIIEYKSRIGDNTVIHAGCYVGHNTVIGEECLIYPNVTIRERIVIGSRVVIHSGTVVGSDGFGFMNIDGAHQKIPQIGTVIVEDDVEIGANVTIDRARFDKTVIGKGTKIDNLVQIAHNVVIGEKCIIVSQSGIAGSTEVGKNVILAGQSGISGHLTVGEGAVIAARTGVTKSIPPHSKVSGYPAKEHNVAKRINACVQRLPVYVATINELKKRIEALESKFRK